MNFQVKNVDWQKMQGLVPAIVQNIDNKQILMMGYMNQAALTQTLNTKRVTFYSRSKETLWVKGETSGNFLELYDISVDCDQDCLLIMARPIGPTCHLGNASCFNTQREVSIDIIAYLEQTILQRRTQEVEGSYVNSLFKQGLAKIAQKVGEEGVEVAIAAVQGDKQNLRNEAADLFFHLLVLLQANEIAFGEVLQLLNERSKEKRQVSNVDVLS